MLTFILLVRNLSLQTIERLKMLLGPRRSGWTLIAEVIRPQLAKAMKTERRPLAR